MKLRHHLFDDFEQVLGSDFAGGSFINTRGSIGDAVFAIVIPPGLDSAPCELVRLAFLVEEDHVADGLVAGKVGCTLSIFECSEDSHFEVVSDAFHMTLAKLRDGRRLGALPYCVAVDFGLGP